MQKVGVMRKKILIGFIFCLILLNVAAWRSAAFCDGFRQYFFHPEVEFVARFMNLFPFSVGEVMIYVGVLLVCCMLLGCLLFLFLRKKSGRRVSFFKKRFFQYSRFFGYLLLVLSFVMTVNCVVLYHSTSFGELYFKEYQKQNTIYTQEQLILVRNYVIEQANNLALEMTRDEAGEIIYTGDIAQGAREAMQNLGKQYALLDGYYPNPKDLKTSKFLSQQYMMGYYFPFSLEANYNGEMYIINMPITMCHELSHLKGFIYEDDANFIGYLACIESKDPFFEYSGYVSVIHYLNQDLLLSLGGNENLYATYMQENDLVKQDNIFLTKEAWDEVNASAIFKTETLKKASDIFLTTSLKLNGVENGMESYGEVVECMLQYYSGTLYEI